MIMIPVKTSTGARDSLGRRTFWRSVAVNAVLVLTISCVTPARATPATTESCANEPKPEAGYFPNQCDWTSLEDVAPVPSQKSSDATQHRRQRPEL
jgi:hypothetical protein